MCFIKVITGIFTSLLLFMCLFSTTKATLLLFIDDPRTFPENYRY